MMMVRWSRTLTFALTLVAWPGIVAAQGGGCWTCESMTECGEAIEWGWTKGCSIFEMCDPDDPNDCWLNCGPKGDSSVCGPEAVALTGQIIGPATVDELVALVKSGGLTFDRDSGVLRKACNGALVVAPEELLKDWRQWAENSQGPPERISLR